MAQLEDGQARDRASGTRSRMRADAHTAEKIAEHVGVHPSTVRRHQRAMSG
ncbi:hypothetical protein KGD82_27855 (plasmid) [Nocardiopsis eucommiae]|uniref:Uncharacterized protein n=1 Tax=Nocardiopsis eucommiae TaxID=2831970 RepID=A0A975LD78_9ACTN|nr:hypothetical protein KGD82_27855 [Nocardiopsis eucommiae]